MPTAHERRRQAALMTCDYGKPWPIRAEAATFLARLPCKRVPAMPRSNEVPGAGAKISAAGLGAQNIFSSSCGLRHGRRVSARGDQIAPVAKDVRDFGLRFGTDCALWDDDGGTESSRDYPAVSCRPDAGHVAP